MRCRLRICSSVYSLRIVDIGDVSCGSWMIGNGVRSLVSIIWWCGSDMWIGGFIA